MDLVESIAVSAHGQEICVAARRARNFQRFRLVDIDIILDGGDCHMSLLHEQSRNPPLMCYRCDS
jgi:hypothetical protein